MPLIAFITFYAFENKTVELPTRHELSLMLGQQALLLCISLMIRDLGGTRVSVSLFTMEKRLANSDLMQVGFLNSAFHLLSAMSMTYIFHIFILSC